MSELSDAALRRMNPHQEVVKGKPAFNRNDDFTIQHKSLRRQREQCRDKLGKITRKRLSGLGLKFEICSIAESDTPKAIPFWFVLPLRPSRNFGCRQGVHGPVRRADR